MKIRIATVTILALIFVGVVSNADISFSASQTDTAVLTVTTALPNEGGRNPLVGAGLFLLRESFESLLRKSGSFTGQPSALRAWQIACVNRSPLCRQGLSQVDASVVSQGQMDGTGRAVLPSVDPGSYYLVVLGLSFQTAQTLIWDLRVDLKAGQNTVTLNQTNVSSLDLRTAKQAAPSAAGNMPTNTAESRVVRPSGPKNSILTLSATDGPHKPVAHHTFYLLDDDFEQILRGVGFKQQMLLGKQLPLLNSFEFVARMVALQQNDPRFAILQGLGGESIIPPEVKQQYDLGLQGLRQHIVATVKTGAGGRGTLPAVPGGNYYVYGTTSEYVHVGDIVTVDRSTVIPTETNRRAVGYDSATIWNMKVALKAGQNSVALTRANAAFVTSR